MSDAGGNQSDSGSTTLHLTIHGHVQGVGFRWSMCEAARALGLKGWVRNRRDGTVEAVAVGPSEALTALREWARHGPRGAHVDRVVEREAQTAEIAPAGSGFVSLPGA